jgi:hypothetical protein
VPWGLSDLACAVPKYKRLDGKIILATCGRILGEAKSPEEAKRSQRACDACETAGRAALKEYATGMTQAAKLLGAHVLSCSMFRGQEVVRMFAQNYAHLRDLDAFRRWWSTNVHPAINGALDLDKFLRDVKFMRNQMLEASTVNGFVPAEPTEPTPAEIEAALGIAPEEASFEPSPQEISATLPESGAITEVPDFDEESEKQRKARRSKVASKGHKSKAAKPADTGATGAASAATEEVTVPKKGIKVMRVAGGDQEEGQ